MKKEDKTKLKKIRQITSLISLYYESFVKEFFKDRLLNFKSKSKTLMIHFDRFKNEIQVYRKTRSNKSSNEYLEVGAISASIYEDDLVSNLSLRFWFDPDNQWNYAEKEISINFEHDYYIIDCVINRLKSKIRKFIVESIRDELVKSYTLKLSKEAMWTLQEGSF